VLCIFAIIFLMLTLRWNCYISEMLGDTLCAYCMNDEGIGTQFAGTVRVCG